MGIFVSLMDIFDQPKREAQIFLWEFFVSLMDIFDQPKREAQIYLWNFLSH